jgi:hypothetical protein
MPDGQFAAWAGKHAENVSATLYIAVEVSPIGYIAGLPGLFRPSRRADPVTSITPQPDLMLSKKPRENQHSNQDNPGNPESTLNPIKGRLRGRDPPKPGDSVIDCSFP